MNRKEYSGNINEKKGVYNLKWTGRQYDYLSVCDKTFKTPKKLEEHEWCCEKCNDFYYEK